MNQFKKMQRNPKGAWWFWAFLIAVAIFFGLMKLTDYTASIKTIPYSDFISLIEKDQVKAIRIEGQQVTGQLHSQELFETTVPETFNSWNLLHEHKVISIVGQPSPVLWYSLLFILLLLIPLGAWLLYRQSRGIASGSGNGNNVFTMSKSRVRMYLPSQIKTRFSSVAGVVEAKEDLADVIDFLRHPEKYRKLGAKLPRGILLVGDPGNGKTLLARAVAGEANCKFFYVNGSEFIEVFVGVGAARVRDLFTEARKNAPSIMFIDEIDAVGRQRGSGLGGGNDEREQTLNQLLTEMDGFAESDKAVVVIAATNRVSVLDKALLRAGRFDRHIAVPYPDVISREQILKVHVQDVKLDSSVDLHKVALSTPGFTGAALQTIINEAAISAAKKNQAGVLPEDIEEARDRSMIGRRNSGVVLSQEERRTVAYHEAGHALVILHLPNLVSPLHKVTILPRGSTLGVAYSIPERDHHTYNREQLLASIMVSLGGRAAEELIFDLPYTGASSDFVAATNIARGMVRYYGMSEAAGQVVYETSSGEAHHYSEKTAETLDREIKAIIDSCYAKTKALLTEQKDKLEKLAQALLAKETLGAQEIYELLDIPPRAIHSLK